MSQTITIWGINNDPEFIKICEFLEHYEIPFVANDFRDVQPELEKIQAWSEHLGQDWPVNLRSTLWKKSERVFLKLTPEEQYLWLLKHYHVIERPIVEDEEKNIISIGGRPERIITIIGKYLSL